MGVISIPTLLLLLDNDNLSLSFAGCVDNELPFFFGGELLLPPTVLPSVDESSVEGSILLLDVDALDSFNFNLNCFFTGDSVSEVSMGIIPSPLVMGVALTDDDDVDDNIDVLVGNCNFNFVFGLELIDGASVLLLFDFVNDDMEVLWLWLLLLSL